MVGKFVISFYLSLGKFDEEVFFLFCIDLGFKVDFNEFRN